MNMIRIIKLILIGTVIFHIVRTTYEVNVLEQKVQSINVVLGRIQKQSGGLDALKKDAAPGLRTFDSLSEGYGAVPHWLSPKPQ